MRKTSHQQTQRLRRTKHLLTFLEDQYGTVKNNHTSTQDELCNELKTISTASYSKFPIFISFQSPCSIFLDDSMKIKLSYLNVDWLVHVGERRERRERGRSLQLLCYRTKLTSLHLQNAQWEGSDVHKQDIKLKGTFLMKKLTDV